VRLAFRWVVVLAGSVTAGWVLRDAARIKRYGLWCGFFFAQKTQSFGERRDGLSPLASSLYSIGAAESCTAKATPKAYGFFSAVPESLFFAQKSRTCSPVRLRQIVPISRRLIRCV
jgi:hypothetical protein